MFRRLAVYIDRIFKGVKPAELPVEQPVVFELALNLKTAAALGLSIPETIVARADKVIELLLLRCMSLLLADVPL
jgi:putative ABC transport system substrate-binding protein